MGYKFFFVINMFDVFLGWLVIMFFGIMIKFGMG